MRVREWMSPDPMTVGVSTTVTEARRLLTTYGIRHLPVVERGRVVGMISDRDVRVSESVLQGAAERMTAVGRAVVDDAIGRGVAVGDVMSSPAQIVGPDESVEAAARLLLSRRISALPVVGHAGALVGVLTTTDCLLALLAQGGEARDGAHDEDRSELEGAEV